MQIAKRVNIIVGLALIAICILNIIAFVKIAFAPFEFFITLFEGIFGMVIISSSFQMRCIRRNFLFMMTGVGRGSFNIYVGLILFLTQGNDTNIANIIMGIAMIVAGSILLFLSKFKNLTDEEIMRAVSVQKQSVWNAVGNAAK